MPLPSLWSKGTLLDHFQLACFYILYIYIDYIFIVQTQIPLSAIFTNSYWSQFSRDHYALPFFPGDQTVCIFCSNFEGISFRKIVHCLGWCHILNLGIVGDCWLYPYQRTPKGTPYISHISRGYFWVISSPRIPRLNTINTMATHTLGVHLEDHPI